jgi:hypothetical protein
MKEGLLTAHKFKKLYNPREFEMSLEYFESRVAFQMMVDFDFAQNLQKLNSKNYTTLSNEPFLLF